MSTLSSMAVGERAIGGSRLANLRLLTILQCRIDASERSWVNLVYDSRQEVVIHGLTCAAAVSRAKDERDAIRADGSESEMPIIDHCFSGKHG